MRLNGEVKFDQPVRVIWKALHDTEVLQDAIPGCQGISLQENGDYKVYLNVAIGPIKGNYSCKVKWEDIDAPHSFFIIVKRWSSVAEIECSLENLNEGTCQLFWNCEAELEGKIAKIGGVFAKHMATTFFKRINKQLLITAK